MQEIKFSVVIPSYKTNDDVMTRTVESVLAQNYKPYEIIVVDDNGGNEYTLINKKLSERYAGKVRFEFYPKNMGANYARNTGIKAATGDYIAFLDSDDEWYPIFLEKVAECIKEKNAEFISCNYCLVRENGRMPPRFNAKMKKSGDKSRQLLLNDVVGPTSAVVVKRSLLLDAGLFDEELPARQDYDMWIRVGQQVPVYYIYEPLLDIVRDGHDSISRSHIRKVTGTKMVMEKILKSYDLTDIEKKEVIHSQYKFMARMAAGANAFKEAASYAKSSLYSKKTVRGYFVYLLYRLPVLFKTTRFVKRMIIPRYH